MLDLLIEMISRSEQGDVWEKAMNLIQVQWSFKGWQAIPLEFTGSQVGQFYTHTNIHPGDTLEHLGTFCSSQLEAGSAAGIQWVNILQGTDSNPATKNYLVQNIIRAEAETELGGSNRKVEMIPQVQIWKFLIRNRI